MYCQIIGVMSVVVMTLGGACMCAMAKDRWGGPCVDGVHKQGGYVFRYCVCGDVVGRCVRCGGRGRRRCLIHINGFDYRITLW